MLAETPITQRSPCYSAVSTLLMNPLPDCSNYSLFCQSHYLILRINTSLILLCRPFTKPLRSSMLQCFNVEISLELMSSEEYCSSLKKLNNKRRQVVMFLLLLLFKLSTQLPFISFLLSLDPLSAPFLNRLSSPFLHFP